MDARNNLISQVGHALDAANRITQAVETRIADS